MVETNSPKLARYATWSVLAIVLLGVGLNSTGLLAAERDYASAVRQVATTIPSLFFIGGIWMVERAFSNLMTRLGFCLLAGGLAFVFAQPLLTKAVLGSSPWGWFDVPAITLGCLGLLLLVLARPLREAAEARSELEEIL